MDFYYRNYFTITNIFILLVDKMIENISWGTEIGLGVAIGLLFIVLNSVFGLVIGIPTLAFSSDTEKLVVRNAVAPIAEELGFRAVLPFILIAIGLPIIAVAVIDIVGFSVFHYVAYGANFAAASSLFIGAGLFALIAFLVTYFRSDFDDFQVPIAAIIGHAIINTWLGIREAGLIIAG